MEQIYIEWRDAVGKSHHTGPEGERPQSVLLKGTAWLVEEREVDVIVAAYYSEDDEGFMDMVAIPKSAIERREPTSHSSSLDGQQASPTATQSGSPQ